MDGFESIFTDILGVFLNHTVYVDFETIFTDFLGVFALRRPIFFHSAYFGGKGIFYGFSDCLL